MLHRRSLLAGPPSLMLASAVGGISAAILRREGHYLLLRVLVGRTAFDALLDFNVRTTLLDLRHAKMLGADMRGTDIVIEAAGRRLAARNVAIIDLADYADRRLHRRIGMVLGRDLFGTGAWMLDLAVPSLIPRDPRAVRRGIALQVSDRFGFATVPIVIDAIPTQAALSFNDLSALRVGAAFAARGGLARPRGTAAALAMVAPREGVAVDRLDIAGVRIADLDAALDAGDHLPDAWLGPAILRRFRIGIDLAAGSLWFDPA